VIADLPVPPSANRMWRHARGRTYRSPEYEAWRESAGLLLNAQRKGFSITGPARMVLRIGKIHGARDGDNCLKPTADLCELVGIVENDRQFRSWHGDMDDSVPAGRMVLAVMAI